jgi:glycosyltransferase involved in cell wall biosynthesis
MYVCNLFPPIVSGGAEISTAILAQAVASRGAQVRVFTLRPDEHHEEIIREESIEIYRSISNLPYWPFEKIERPFLKKLRFQLLDNNNKAAALAFEEQIRRFKPDLVSTHALSGISAAVWPVARRFGAALIHTTHDYNIICPRSTMHKRSRVCTRQCLECAIFTLPRKLASRSVNTVVANSAYVRQRHREAGYFASAEWHIIPPILRDDMRPLSRARRPDPCHLVFGYLGRIVPEKGVHVLIDALSAAGMDWKLNVAGTGPEDYLNDLKRRANGRVHFQGWTAPNDFFDTVDVLVLPSVWPEPAGRTILEAYQHRIPVITTNRGGMPELVLPGVTGWVVNLDIKDHFKSILERIADASSWNDISVQKMDEIFERQRAGLLAERYLNIYNETIARGGVRARIAR